MATVTVRTVREARFAQGTGEPPGTHGSGAVLSVTPSVAAALLEGRDRPGDDAGPAAELVEAPGELTKEQLAGLARGLGAYPDEGSGEDGAVLRDDLEGAVRDALDG